MSRRDVDILAFAILWAAALTGAALIAVHGGNVVAVTLLWLDVLLGAVLLALLAVIQTPEVPATEGAGLLPFVVSAFLVLVYVAAAGVALGGGAHAAFAVGSTIAAAYLVVRDRRRGDLPPVGAPS